MSTYVIGDVQGCFNAFQRLLKTIEFDPNIDSIIFAGDLIARGENSLGIMHWVLQNSNVCQAVLGNHDLNFLAVSMGLRQMETKDKIASLLNDSRLDEIISWYRYCPLVLDLPEHNALIVHAGIWPDLKLETLLEESGHFESALRNFSWQNLLKLMYEKAPDHWADATNKISRIQFLINACTRMRFLHRSTHRLDFTYKSSPIEAPNFLIPWMDVDPVSPIDRQIFFGHWASLLGSRRNDQIFALDTGCVWGYSLTAIRLEDRTVFEVSNAN